MSDFVLEAAPLTRAEIIGFAEQFREALGVTDLYLPVPELIEHVLPQVFPGYEFDVRDHAEMGDRHGLWDPIEQVLALRDDVYAGVIRGKGRDRSTGMHEVGHAMLHSATMNRVASSVRLAAYRDPEWQANTFSAAVLMPPRLVARCCSLDEITKTFGVTISHAATWVHLAGIILNRKG